MKEEGKQIPPSPAVAELERGMKASSDRQLPLRAYTDDERRHLFAKFQFVLAAYRQGRSKAYAWLGGVLGAFALFILAGSFQLSVVAIFAFVGIFAAGAGALRQVVLNLSTLLCPGCRESLLDFGPFCPQCGGTDIARGWGFVRSPQCRHCGTTLQYGKNIRVFTHRFCSCCGLKVANYGI